MSGLFLVFLVLVACLVWLITGCLGFGVVACVFVACPGCLLCVWCVCACCLVVCAPWWLVLFVGRGGWCALAGYWVVVLFVWCVCARKLCVRVGFVSCLWGVGVSGVCGGRGCLGAGCVVAGGGLPVWLGDVVASGGVSVGFDVGLRVFVLSGVGVPASGGVSAPVGSSAPVSGLVGSGAGVLVGGAGGSESGSVVEDSVSSSDVSASVPVDVAGGVRVCVPCVVRVFGDGWCSLVLRRWASAAGIDVGVAGVLLGSVPELGSSSGRVSSSSALSPLSGSASVGSPMSMPSSSVANGGGRVGVGFGGRVCDWGARVGVGGGVGFGGGVVAHLWAGARGRVSALVSGVGVKGLVLAGVVCALVLASVLVCFL